MELIRKHCVAAARDNGYLRWLWCEEPDRDIDWIMDLTGTRGHPGHTWVIDNNCQNQLIKMSIICKRRGSPGPRNIALASESKLVRTNG